MSSPNPRNAATSHKKTITSLHRVIDRHRPGRNDASSMLEIRQILGRTIIWQGGPKCEAERGEK